MPKERSSKAAAVEGPQYSSDIAAMAIAARQSAAKVKHFYFQAFCGGYFPASAMKEFVSAMERVEIDLKKYYTDSDVTIYCGEHPKEMVVL